MPYQFPPDLDERVKAEMSRRGLSNEDDVLREALDALSRLDEEKLRRWHEGNQVAIEQSQRGMSRPLDLESILARVEERLAKHQQTS